MGFTANPFRILCTASLACVQLLFLTWATPCRAGAVDKAQEAKRTDAIRDGLRWLAGGQQPSGAFAGGKTAGISGDVAVTSLAGLALLASGSEPDKGDYGRQLRSAIEYVISSQKDSGLFGADEIGGPMYGHGYATLFLAESYMKNRDDRLQSALQKAVSLLEKTANRDGGWRYQPKPFDADISVTACELNALLAARAAGIEVDPRTIQAATEYVHKCQNQDGGFSYMSGQGGIAGSGFPRSAAAVAVLLHGGAKTSDPALARAIDYVSAFFGPDQAARRTAGHYYYGVYYASQWLPAAGQKQRNDYNALVREVLDSRKGDHWQGDFSEDYATASALIVLQASERRLWIFSGEK